MELKSNVSMVDTNDLDSNIRNMLLAAQDYVERAANCLLTPATVTEVWEAFPWNNKPMELSIEPVRSLTSLTYIDTNGVTQTIVPQTLLTSARPRLFPPINDYWPAVQPGNNVPITVVYTAGPANTKDARPSLRAAVLTIASQNFEFSSGWTKQGGLTISPMAENLISAGMQRGL